MDSCFDAETPVLFYRLRPHPKAGPRNERSWLLWPAWAYRVVAPKFERRAINALQQAALATLRACRMTAEELGEALGVHHELAAFVVLELQTQGRVDENWQVTSRGIEALDQQREASATLVPGWVFQDPWTESLWPVVEASLEYAKTQRSEGRYPLLELGTTGTPWLQRAWMQFPRKVERPGVPGPREIIRAAEAGARLARRALRLELPDEDDGISSAAARIDIRRISTIDPDPVPVFLTTYLYVPRDDDHDIDWYACEFFGRGHSPELRRLVDKLACDDRNLDAQLDRLLVETLGQGIDVQRKAAQGRVLRARQLMERALTVDISNHGVAEPLVEVFEGLLELGELGEGAGLRRRRTVLASCRLTLERLFGDLADTWSVVGVDERLTRDDKQYNELQIRAAATMLGISELPRSFCNVTSGQLHRVTKYKDGRLRALVVANLLCARDQPEHPLRVAAARAPELLERVDFVANEAGAAVHDGGEARLERVNVDDVVRACVEIVAHICHLPVQGLEELPNHG